MLVLMGPCCTGKSSVAELLSERTGVGVITGKDYLSLSVSEDEAWKIFKEKLERYQREDLKPEASIIYILDDAAKARDLISMPGVVCVKFTSTLELIIGRYEARLQGQLPSVVTGMLKDQKTAWDTVRCTTVVESNASQGIDVLARQVLSHAVSKLKH